MKKLRRDNSDYKILKEAKSDYQKLKTLPLKFKETQDDILKAFLDSGIPRWGAISLKITKI